MGAVAGIVPRREKNGRKSRRLVDRLNEANRRDHEAVLSVVLAQPHRKGQRSALAASALGRFCLAHGLDPDVAAGVEIYQRRRAVYRATIGAPRLDQVVDGNSTTEGPDRETVSKWKEHLAKIEEAVEDVVAGGLALVDMLIDAEADVPAKSAAATRAALIAMARACGKHV
jgi:hypothetical protein